MHILHLEDSLADHQLMCRALTKAGLDFSVTRVDTLDDFATAATSSPFDLVLADYRLSGFTALNAWTSWPEAIARPPFILLSGTIGEAAAVAAIHLGISDYLHKDDLGKLERVIRRALEVEQVRAAKERSERELAASEKRLSELSGYLQVAIERERASIAREIHDDIGGSLAAVNLELAWLARHSTPTSALAHLQSATEMIQHAIGASQRIMMNLRPSILDQGLYAAVQWLAQGFERRTGIKTTLRTNNEHLAPDKTVQLVAYRTTQEALTNASKHAQCTAVQIEISDAENFLTVEISDNGKGIAVTELAKPQSFGIRGLHERAKTVGGWLDISSQLGGGTSITLSIPLMATSSEEGTFQ